MKKGTTEDMAEAEVVVDVKHSPMVLWYPKTKELVVCIAKMLTIFGYRPLDDDCFKRLKQNIHNRIKEAFESKEINTLVQARLLAIDCISKAAKRGELIGPGPASMKGLSGKQVVN